MSVPFVPHYTFFVKCEDLTPFLHTKLIYKENVLIAVNTNHRLLVYNEEHKIPAYIPVDIIDDPDAFDHIDVVKGELMEYTRQKLPTSYIIPYFKDTLEKKALINKGIYKEGS